MTGDRVPLPVYKGTVIYACPECDGTIQYAGGTDYICQPCDRAWSFAQIIPYEDGDLDD